jgi:hypothetical protein
MEKVEAAVHGWEQTPYEFKGEVDANFKRMLHYACEKPHAEAVRVGVGSHNLFDVSYALLLRERQGVRERVEIEMLEGMANHQARVVEEVGGSLLFYAPSPIWCGGLMRTRPRRIFCAIFSECARGTPSGMINESDSCWLPRPRMK